MNIIWWHSFPVSNLKQFQSLNSSSPQLLLRFFSACPASLNKSIRHPYPSPPVPFLLIIFWLLPAVQEPPASLLFPTLSFFNFLYLPLSPQYIPCLAARASRCYSLASSFKVLYPDSLLKLFSSSLSLSRKRHGGWLVSAGDSVSPELLVHPASHLAAVKTLSGNISAVKTWEC